jgi:hypothetical protein
MVDLLNQRVSLGKRLVQPAFVALALDRHADDIRGALQKGDVMLSEFTFRTAVYFENTVGTLLALQNHVDGTTHTVVRQQFWR